MEHDMPMTMIWLHIEHDTIVERYIKHKTKSEGGFFNLDAFLGSEQ